MPDPLNRGKTKKLTPREEKEGSLQEMIFYSGSICLPLAAYFITIFLFLQFMVTTALFNPSKKVKKNRNPT